MRIRCPDCKEEYEESLGNCPYCEEVVGEGADVAPDEGTPETAPVERARSRRPKKIPIAVPPAEPTTDSLGPLGLLFPMMVTSLLCLFLGGGACFAALWGMGYLSKPPMPEPVREKPEDKVAILMGKGRYGEAVKVLANLPPDQTNRPEIAVTRAKARFLDLLQARRTAGKPLGRDDPEVQQLFQELTSVSSAESLLARGDILEYLEKWEEVEPLYRKGQDEFPAAHEEFQLRLQRVQNVQGKGQ